MQPTPIKPGDCFLNVRTLSCLRVRRVSGEHADYMSWRPDGSRQTVLGRVKLASLRLLPYWRMEAVRVFAGGQSFEWAFDEPEVQG